MLSSVIPSENAKWEVKEVPTPQPGINQVLIKIHARHMLHRCSYY